MKLVSVQVTNFRSVDDSNEFEIGQSTCLVGKNEAGKTAVLQAIHGLKPLTDFSYNTERDYPRVNLNDYEEKHGKSEAEVIRTRWKLDAYEVRLVNDALCEGALADDTIIIIRCYNENTKRWGIKIDEKAIVDHFIKSESLNAAEKKQVGTHKDLTSLTKSLSSIESPTDKQRNIKERATVLTETPPLSIVVKLLDDRIPSFMYFSHYDRMSGQISIEKLNRDTQTNAVSDGDSVFQDFMTYAGTTIDELKDADRFESLNSKCEAASNKITDQIFEYWSQNDSLSIEVLVGRGESGDEAPFNTGTVVRARVKNSLHRVTVPFSERSAGFIWFFSFLVKFAQVKKHHGNVIILLDEPGLTLHGKAQADLLRYFKEQLEPHHQVIFSTHSPFMVPTDNYAAVRIVEDVITVDDRERKKSIGTKVSSDALATDSDTLFPLQGALGYELTQSLFVGPNTLLVEGPSDILYIQSVSNCLKNMGRTSLSSKWTLSPSAGVDKMMPLVSLFVGNNINVAVLTDVAKGNKMALRRLEASGILSDNHVHRITDFIDEDEGDIEDMLSPQLFTKLINKAFNLSTDKKLTHTKLLAVESDTNRMVKKAEDYFKLLPPEIDEFDHY